MKVVLAALMLAAAGPPPPASETIRIPQIGLEGPAHDACPGIGRINGFEPRKGDFLRVRAEASQAAAVTDKLKISALVWLCEADDGWQGIVYPGDEKQDLGDCKVSIALTKPEEYHGPCKYGWVEAKYVDLVTG